MRARAAKRLSKGTPLRLQSDVHDWGLSSQFKVPKQRRMVVFVGNRIDPPRRRSRVAPRGGDGCNQIAMNKGTGTRRESSADAPDTMYHQFQSMHWASLFEVAAGLGKPKRSSSNLTQRRMGHDAGESTGVDPTFEELQQRVKTDLGDPLEEKWDEAIGQWRGAASSERRAVRRHVTGLRDRVLRSLLAAETLDELKRGLALGYAEMKCHWTMLNTRIQHQTAQTGRPDEALIYRATCVSLIVQALEPLLNREDVKDLAAFLAEPLG